MSRQQTIVLTKATGQQPGSGHCYLRSFADCPPVYATDLSGIVSGLPFEQSQPQETRWQTKRRFGEKVNFF